MLEAIYLLFIGAGLLWMGFDMAPEATRSTRAAKLWLTLLVFLAGVVVLLASGYLAWPFLWAALAR